MEEEQLVADDPGEEHCSGHENHSTLGPSLQRTLSSSSSKSVHSTRTLHSIDLEGVSENGRDYPNRIYYMPCDQLEQTRLSIQHQVYLAILNGALTTAPITAGIQRVLDVGTGPGDWAVAMSQRYPDAEIVAVDLAVWDIDATETAASMSGEDHGEVVWEIDDLDIWGPLNSKANANAMDDIANMTKNLEIDEAIPDNARDSGFETTHEDADQTRTGSGKDKGSIDLSQFLRTQRNTGDNIVNPDSSRPPQIGWNFSETFDFIHLRGMRGAFADWLGVYREAYRNLLPGGWIEVVDFTVTDPATTATVVESETTRLYQYVHMAAQRSGYPLSTSHLDVDMFLKAGFDEISIKDVSVPVGLWPEDEELRRVGKMWLVCMAETTEAVALRLLTKWLDFSVEKVKRMCRTSTQELLSGKLGKVETNFRFVRARRPKR